LDVTTETVAPREIEFTIHPEAAQVEDAMRKAARKAAQRVRIPGFRPGKAPYALIERTVGKELLTEEAAEILAPDLYKQVIEKGGYEPYDRPTLRIAQQEPLELKIRVPLEPTVELGDYYSLRIDPGPEPEVTDEEVDKLLQEIREQQSTWVPVERPAQMGDQVTLDIKGRSEEEDIFDEAGTTLVLSEQLAPPGFGEALVGMNRGETREFTLSYPEDHPSQGLAGKAVSFTITLHELKERKLPDLDDELARSVGDYASLEELKDRLRTGLKAEKDAEARDSLAVRTLDQLVEQSNIEFPGAAVEREIQRLTERLESRLRQQGFTLENYLRLTHKSPAQLHDELRPEAEEQLRRSLVLREVAKAEKIEVKPDELNAEIDRIASAYGEQAAQVRQALMQPEPVAGLMNDIYSRKALERLLDIVTGKAECAAQAAPAEAPKAGEEAAPAVEEETPTDEAGETPSSETPATE
jgi:trigger factor